VKKQLLAALVIAAASGSAFSQKIGEMSTLAQESQELSVKIDIAKKRAELEKANGVESSAAKVVVRTSGSASTATPSISREDFHLRALYGIGNALTADISFRGALPISFAAGQGGKIGGCDVQDISVNGVKISCAKGKGKQVAKTVIEIPVSITPVAAASATTTNQGAPGNAITTAPLPTPVVAK